MPNPIPNDARTPNVTETKRWCRYCRNDGMVELSVGMVPCPMCEAGYEKEFQNGSVWADTGFWKDAPAELEVELEQADNQKPVGADVALLELEKIRGILYDVDPEKAA